MHTEVPEVLVTAPRVTLDEILDRVARGEARRDSAIRDQSFTCTIRMAHGATKSKPATVLEERVYRVYKKKPDRLRTVLLRQVKAEPEKRGGMQINFRTTMDEEIVNFAFRPSARRDFRYHIIGRDVVGNYLIYKIAFEPKSPLDPSDPSGVVWVNTNEFVIVRQEINFERSPVPLFIKGVERMVVERQRADGLWVLSRVMMRARTTIPIPKIGTTFDFTIQYDQYRNNQGLADSLFEGVSVGMDQP